MSERKQVTAAGAFIFDREERVFLAKFEKKFGKKWSIPGGKLDFGESPEEAVIREVKEETNMDVKHPYFFEHGTFVEGNTHVIYMDYMFDCPETYDIKINEEFSEYKFVSLQDLDSLDIIPKTKASVLSAMRYRSQKRWVEKLTEYKLGLIRKTAYIQEPQKLWADAFQWISQEIHTVLKTPLEHVGSTYIPNLPSKPIIDILIVYKDKDEFQKQKLILEQLGFVYKGDAVSKVKQSDFDEQRHFFAYYNPQENIDYVHLHALQEGHPDIRKLLDFRNRLSSDPELVQKYSELKRNLLKQGLSRHEYTRAKDSLFQSIR